MSVASENPYLLTLPDLLSAKRKLAVVAASYDPKKISLKGFECLSLDPTEFREQLRRNFLISVTNAELGALVVLFDKVLIFIAENEIYIIILIFAGWR